MEHVNVPLFVSQRASEVHVAATLCKNAIEAHNKLDGTRTAMTVEEAELLSKAYASIELHAGELYESFRDVVNEAKNRKES